jgi:WD40 repeat protein
MIAKEQVSEGVTDVWRIRDGTLLHTLRYAEMMQPYGWHPDEYVFSELAWSPDGRMLLVGASYSDSAFDDDIPDGGAWIWRVRDGALLWSVVLEDGVRGVTWLPDGQHIATQSSGDLQIWRMPSQP